VQTSWMLLGIYRTFLNFASWLNPPAINGPSAVVMTYAGRFSFGRDTCLVFNQIYAQRRYSHSCVVCLLFLFVYFWLLMHMFLCPTGSIHPSWGCCELSHPRPGCLAEHPSRRRASVSAPIPLQIHKVRLFGSARFERN
jgi:hypothetical protein